MVGSVSDGIIASGIESIKILSGVAFDSIGTDVANVTGGVFDIGLSLMQESVNNGFKFLANVQPSPLMYVSFGAKFGEIGTNVWGAYSLNQKTEALNNINIAISYLEDFYQYGGENSLVAVKEAKITATANMYDTIYHYASNKGYHNSWWTNEFNYSKIVEIVENVKSNVSRVLQKCYVNGECLAQEQKDSMHSYSVYTINGIKIINR